MHLSFSNIFSLVHTPCPIEASTRMDLFSDTCYRDVCRMLYSNITRKIGLAGLEDLYWKNKWDTIHALLIFLPVELLNSSFPLPNNYSDYA